MKVAIVVVLVLAAADGHADPIAEAKAYYQAGVEAYGEAKYAMAIAAFEQAYALAPDRPSVQFSLAQAERSQFFVDSDGGKAKRALGLFRSYVTAVTAGKQRDEAVHYIAELTPVVASYDAQHTQPAPPPAAKTELMVSSRAPHARAAIDGGAAADVPLLSEVTAGHHTVHVEAVGYAPLDTDGTAVDGHMIVVEAGLRELPASIRVVAPEGSEIVVDGTPAGDAPLAPLAVAAGSHVIEVRARGHLAYTHELSVARGEHASLHADLVRTDQRTAAYVLGLGAGALALGGGIETVLAVLARSDANSVAAMRTTVNLTDAQRRAQNDRVDDFHRDSDLAYALYGGAAAVLATGIALYVLDHPHGETRRSAPAIVPLPSADGMTLVWARRF